MIQFLKNTYCMIYYAVERICTYDNETYDPSWMDLEAWRETR